MLPAVDTRVDCIGLFCPAPILRVREAIQQMAVGQVLEMVSDDPAAEADMKSWSVRTGHELLAIDKDAAALRFLVRKTR